MSNDLFSLISNYHSAAVVGMAKNTGKTVTINYLIEYAARAGIVVALTSTGRDGEVQDIVSNLPKPQVQLPEGAVLATSRDSLNRGSAGLELLQNTGVTNPLGEIVIARVRRAGTVEVSGPERSEDLLNIRNRMLKYAELVLIDGALDRRAASAPALTEATILATGAAVATTSKSVAAATVHQVRMLTLPAIVDCPQPLRSAVSMGRVAVYADQCLASVPVATAVDGPAEILDYLGKPGAILGLGGALADEMLELLVEPARRYRGLQVVVHDGTRIFVTPAVWQRFSRVGGTVTVLTPINLVAVTVNPVDPRGRQFPVGELEKMLRDVMPDMPIYNPLAGGAGNLE